MGIEEMRDWAEALEPYELFNLDEVQDMFPAMSRTAVIAGLGRLCNDDDPLMCRPARGWYCRRIQDAPYPVPVPPMVYPHLGWRIAGPGAGMTGPYVANRIHWSTQVPPRIWIAVVGRPPRTPVPIVFTGRSNKRRAELTMWEASLLEAIRDFDTWSEITWPKALDKHADYLSRDWIGAIRSELFVEVADAERGQGKLFRQRCRELAAIAGPTGIPAR
ncbi:hypothetical protein [Candidatus Poriferisocius sp.]|uniref:hypothetical protein n=1 Tax=Candidatus Poriferisocius sp. TaxID=3101276 RepID=UPI003B02D2FE